MYTLDCIVQNEVITAKSLTKPPTYNSNLFVCLSEGSADHIHKSCNIPDLPHKYFLVLATKSIIVMSRKTNQVATLVHKAYFFNLLPGYRHYACILLAARSTLQSTCKGYTRCRLLIVIQVLLLAPIPAATSSRETGFRPSLDVVVTRAVTPSFSLQALPAGLGHGKPSNPH
jgi:hypothetical protein